MADELFLPLYIFKTAKNLSTHDSFVYKIPYRRARAWPLGRVHGRAKVSCIQIMVRYIDRCLKCRNELFSTLSFIFFGKLRRACLITLHSNFNFFFLNWPTVV